MGASGWKMGLGFLLGPASFSAAMNQPVKNKPPKRSDPRAEEARRKALISEHARSGRQASILTSGQGLLDEAIISKPVIMGKPA